MTTITPADYFTSPPAAAPPTVLDVRSPGEFAAGHLPGARSLPLFTDAERAEVGTLYKQTSPDAALLRGLELAGGKLRDLVTEARTLAPAGRVVVQCWRGGQRSASVAWLLERAGMEVSQLAGGYKAYRAFVRDYFTRSVHFFQVLSGPTGTGKTPILLALRELGEAVIDLEGLANHKGSSFGALGEDPQPTTEQFENALFGALYRIPAGRRVWLEDESRLIGTVCQPDPFYDRLLAAPVVELTQPLEWRLTRLVSDYARYPKADLAAAFTRIRKKLGGQHLNAALAALEAGDFTTAARTALVYYDRAYAHYGTRRRADVVATLAAADPAADRIAAQLRDWSLAHPPGVV